MTIAAIANLNPLQAGLEELVAYLRVAKSIKAIALEKKERVEICDKQGVFLQASIPSFLLSADLFPDDINELIL